MPEGLSLFNQVLATQYANKMSLITGALPAQYGFHSAAAVNAVTKSGTNTLHGDAFDRAVLVRRLAGSHAWAFWIIVVFALLPVQLFWFSRFRRSGLAVALVGIAAAIGSFGDHFMLLIVTLSHDFLPSSAHPYAMGAWGLATLAGSVGPIIGQNYGAKRHDRVRRTLTDGEGAEGVTPRAAAAYLVHTLAAQAGGDEIEQRLDVDHLVAGNREIADGRGLGQDRGVVGVIGLGVAGDEGEFIGPGPAGDLQARAVAIDCEGRGRRRRAQQRLDAGQRRATQVERGRIGLQRIGSSGRIGAERPMKFEGRGFIAAATCVAHRHFAAIRPGRGAQRPRARRARAGGRRRGHAAEHLSPSVSASPA